MLSSLTGRIDWVRVKILGLLPPDPRDATEVAGVALHALPPPHRRHRSNSKSRSAPSCSYLSLFLHLRAVRDTRNAKPPVRLCIARHLYLPGRCRCCVFPACFVDDIAARKGSLLGAPGEVVDKVQRLGNPGNETGRYLATPVQSRVVTSPPWTSSRAGNVRASTGTDRPLDQVSAC